MYRISSRQMLKSQLEVSQDRQSIASSLPIVNNEPRTSIAHRVPGTCSITLSAKLLENDFPP